MRNTQHDSIHAVYMIEKQYWNASISYSGLLLGIQRIQKELKLNSGQIQVMRRKWICKCVIQFT